MARENQGLQIALIAFVVLTILFSVTTFMFFRQYREASDRANAHQEETRKAREASNALLDESNKLKAMVGFAATDKLDRIQPEFQKDMDTYAANFEPENRVYRKVLQYLNDIIQKKNVALVAEQDQVKSLQFQLASLEQVKQPQIDQHLQAATQAATDLKNERDVFSKELKDTKENNDQLLVRLNTSQKEAETATQQAAAKQKEADDRIRMINDQYLYTREKLEKMISPTFEAAHGQIRWVDQRDHTLWINLGRADGLKRQTTFSVFSSNINDVTKAGRKGSIEVTEILGEHMAEARIVEDQTSNPIMPGDVIYTPVWAPGQKEHFALTGSMDIDGDGKSDRELIHNLLASNGAVIDAESDDKGVRTGQMTSDTRYLVLGGAPDSKATREMTNSFTEMKREAEQLGIRTISLQDLLRRMGYKDENRVVHFGKHTDRKDFPSKFPEGELQRVSHGDLSPLYLDKQKPPASRGNGY